MHRSAHAAVAAIFAIVSTPGCDTSTATESTSRDAELHSVYLGEREEARAFLERGDSVVWSEHASIDDVDRLVTAMYDAGVVRAEFAGIEALEDSRISATLVFELPEDARRDDCFVEFNRFREAHVGDVVDDRGQRRVEVTLD